ncbi:SycD/LcrH family type III secretion system chaperone [Yersinia aleksiciae]|uniref:SycD/LcrH family type III secretion system chaperone n=1 Tax=Yersinia aleksiciae TaxID=263819 RepID=UPI0011A97D33|nr:SycD/LcrH family type III secretion system chaperone [Yersinia aleksiciae]MDN0125109.1 SycD/LcrH family type III secretion system chaperone [Yersinia aleksiciae]
MADFGIEGLQALSIQINNALKEQGIISQEIIDNHQPASQQEVQRIYARGYQAWLADDYVAAMADFSWLTIHCPLEFRFHLALAGAMQMQQEYVLALSAYACALLLEGKDPAPVYQMAICLQALGKGADAREALQTAIEMSYLSPEYAPIAEKASLLLNQI